jgi:polysaccharide export outer membrane protein
MNYSISAGFCSAIVLAGCSSFLSQSGPHRAAVIDGAGTTMPAPGQVQPLPYALVQLDQAIVAKLGADDLLPTFSEALTDTPTTGGLLGVGDTVGLTIFEAGAGGLFIPSEPGTRAGNYVTLPSRQIDTQGNISVPYAGNVHAAGLTPAEVEQEIDRDLGAHALHPQAIVSVVDRRADAVTVTGEVAAAAHFSLDPGGERMLGAIARAGGPRFPAYETMVVLQRRGRTERALLSEIMRDSRQNIALEPGDGIYVAHMPRYFLAMGATGPGQSIGLVNRRFTFDDSQLSLADALAKAGGLEDDRANAQAIFIYRFEPQGPFQEPPRAGQSMIHPAMAVSSMGEAPPGGFVPTIYLLDLTKPEGYFYANLFRMHNKDTIYVANSPSTDLAKFLSLILPAAYSVSNVRTGVQ